MPEGPEIASWPRLGVDARDLLNLAAWLGHLQRSQRAIEPNVPPAHWRDLLAAFLVHESPTGRWVQAAADAGLLFRESLLPSPAIVREAHWRSLRGEAPPQPVSDEGLFTRSVVDVVDAAATSVDEVVPVTQPHLLAQLVLQPAVDHRKELEDLSRYEELCGFVGLWLLEFPAVLESSSLHYRSAQVYWNRIFQRERPAPEVASFCIEAPLWTGGGPFGPWLAALLQGTAAHPVVNFITEHKALIQSALGIGDAVHGPVLSQTIDGIAVIGGTALAMRARDLAEKVSPGQGADLRHVLGALLAADPALLPLPAEPEGDPDQLRTLRGRFLTFVTSTAGNELRAAWASAILGASLASVPVVQDTGRRDKLDFIRYARALASVIVDRDVVPPFSIGLFGAWGSGKSFLIDRIKDEIKDIAIRAGVGGDDRFCRGIVLVDFNAWHYAETNLWASLFVQILEALGDRLRDGPIDSPARQRGAILAAIGRTHAQLREAEDAAARETRRAEDIGENLKAAGDAVRAAGLLTGLLAALGYRADRAEADAEPAAVLAEARQTYAELTEDFSAAKQTYQSLRHSVQRIWRLRFSGMFWAAAVAAGASVLLGAVFWHSLLGALVAVGPVLVMVLERVKSYRNWVKEALPKLRELIDQADAEVKTAEGKTFAELRSEQVKAEDAAKQHRATAEELRGRVAALTAKSEELEPRRLLATFVAERALSEEYGKLLGVPAMIRRDITQLTEYLRDAQANPATRVDRIVLCVDDLDRCPPETVVRVLEAVHILLASSLFVVIVGVDPRWLNAALVSRFPALFSTENANGATPTEFLEKIFQVPFWIPGMSPLGRRSLVADILPRQVALPARGAAVAVTPTFDPFGRIAGGGPEAVDGAVATPALTVGPVSLEPEEQSLLLALSAAAGDTPRRLKRFVRCYLILRASLDRDRLAWLADPDLREAPARLLAAANGAPKAWPRLREALQTDDENRLVIEAINDVFVDDLDELANLRAAFEIPLPNAPTGDDAPKPLRVVDLRLWLPEIERFTFPE